MPGIDLTPPQEIKKQRTHYVVGVSTKLSLMFFLLLLGVSLIYFYRATSVKSQISSAKGKIAELTSQRDSMKEIESYAKKLSGKYFLLQRYLESRTRYSSVVLELLARVPEGVSLENVSFEGIGKSNTISGSCKDIVEVSTFVNALSKEGAMSSESATDLSGKQAFTNVNLDSLRVSEEAKTINYNISFKINEEAFVK